MSAEGIEITLRDVYAEQRHTTEQLTAIGTQLATFTIRVDARLDSGQTKLDDHEQRLRLIEAAPKLPADHEARLRALEKFRFTLVGAVLALQACAVVVEYLLSRK